MSQPRERAKIGLDSSSLFDALDAVRSARGIQWKQVAKETGVSASTLTRMAQGKRPDVDGFAALTAWLGNDPRQYFTGDLDTESAQIPGEAVAVGAFISALFRANPKLTAEEREALKSLASGAYKLATRSTEGK